MSYSLTKYVLSLHMITGWGGSIIGSYEVYNNNKYRFFSMRGDDFHKGSARGLIKGLSFPYKTIIKIPNIINKTTIPPWSY